MSLEFANCCLITLNTVHLNPSQHVPLQPNATLHVSHNLNHVPQNPQRWTNNASLLSMQNRRRVKHKLPLLAHSLRTSPHPPSRSLLTGSSHDSQRWCSPGPCYQSTLRTILMSCITQHTSITTICGSLLITDTLINIPFRFIRNHDPGLTVSATPQDVTTIIPLSTF